MPHKSCHAKDWRGLYRGAADAVAASVHAKISHYLEPKKLILNKLAKLEPVGREKVWKNEAGDFTPWLAENLQLLSDSLGLSDLELRGTEVKIGKYKADIVAEETATGRTVVIENQFGDTDHGHLGQIITYAAGADAEIIIWISEKITEEHRKALDWLNETSDEEYGFFGVQIELWKIGNSEPAPKFHVVCSPNEWAKEAKKQSHPPSPMHLLYQDFWQSLKEYMEENGTKLGLAKPSPGNYYPISVGKTGFSINLTVSGKHKKLGCAIYIGGRARPDGFKLLEQHKESIENELNTKLDWRELPDKTDSRILLERNGDISKKEHWGEYHAWFKEWGEKFHKCFSPIILTFEQ